MEVKGFYPDVHIHNIVIDSLCKKEKSDQSYKLLNEICERGLMPPEVSLNPLINGFCRKERLTIEDHFFLFEFIFKCSYV